MLRKYAKNIVPEGATCTHLQEENTCFKFKNDLGREYSTTVMVNNLTIPMSIWENVYRMRLAQPYCERCTIWLAEKWLSEPFDEDHFRMVDFHFNDLANIPTFEEAARVFKCRGDCLLVSRHLNEAYVDGRCKFRLYNQGCWMSRKCLATVRKLRLNNEKELLRLLACAKAAAPEHGEFEINL